MSKRTFAIGFIVGMLVTMLWAKIALAEITEFETRYTDSGKEYEIIYQNDCNIMYFYTESISKVDHRELWKERESLIRECQTKRAGYVT